MDSLNDYARALESALRWKRAYSAYNRDMVHAKIVVTAAFRGANEKIRLLSHRLDRDLYASQSFIDEATAFVGKRGGHVDILVETDVPDDHPLRALARRHPDNVTINRVPDEIVDGYGFNFMLIDEIGYRFEGDRENHRALVVVHDKKSDEFNDTMRMLDNIFTHLKRVAAPAS